jgi:hypothetical protein
MMRMPVMAAATINWRVAALGRFTEPAVEDGEAIDQMRKERNSRNNGTAGRGGGRTAANLPGARMTGATFSKTGAASEVWFGSSTGAFAAAIVATEPEQAGLSRHP